MYARLAAVGGIGGGGVRGAGACWRGSDTHSMIWSLGEKNETRFKHLRVLPRLPARLGGSGRMSSNRDMQYCWHAGVLASWLTGQAAQAGWLHGWHTYPTTRRIQAPVPRLIELIPGQLTHLNAVEGLELDAEVGV